MKLADWLEQHKIKREDFARQVGVTPQAITGWCDGTFGISRDKANDVYWLTGGQVTPNDFFVSERPAGIEPMAPRQEPAA